MKISAPTSLIALGLSGLIAVAALPAVRAQVDPTPPFPTIEHQESAAQVTANKAAVHHFFVTVWETGDLSLVDQYIEPDAKDYSPLGTGSGTASFKHIISMFHAALSNIKANGTEIGDGDLVTHFWKIEGMHDLGPLMGVPPTHKMISLSGATTVRVGADGKISARWSQLDMYGLLLQLGVIPPPKPEGK